MTQKKATITADPNSHSITITREFDARLDESLAGLKSPA